ncbi:class I SAM-dependent methyltransferase [Acinetobacter sp. ANC 4945]|uniref:Methyltransferase n=1 Tax=Acinetobacter amyesii TaxID=2942470 RepID=A0A1T1H127_9GAMM|nr:class I SAM-dependent methyltransferase [Acinetobacter amyesii]MCL6247703.1 class I SAM-dependent methyltransferase [Acinetobacter amyesii]OOV83475.1 methyltransferase [Acinetobacter amyesii]
MSILNEGYVVDVPYPTFVHRQAMPVWLSSLAQLKGNQAPDLQKPYRYLELGCAMGIHLNLTAAANPMGHFVGVDFNAQQLLVAKEGIQSTNIQNLEFIHASFEQLEQQDLEPFDFIVTHGVWSWISDENQKTLLRIIDKFLKPNGLVYCSYMSYPGAAELSSVQKLMSEMSKNLKGNSAEKAVQSLSFVQKLGQQQVGIFTQIPSLNQTLANLAQDKPNYIAHDFLSEHWQPQHSADMIRAFGKQHLSFITGANIAEHIDAVSLKPEVQKLIQSLPLVTLQETARDIALNSLQRQDIYIKNRKKLSATEFEKALSQIKFGVMPHAPVHKSLSNNPKIGRVHDILPICEYILKLLEKQDLSLLEMAQSLKLNIQPLQLRDILLILVWAGYIHPLNPETQARFEQPMNAWMQQQQLAWRCIAKYGTAVE